MRGSFFRRWSSMQNLLYVAADNFFTTSVKSLRKTIAECATTAYIHAKRFDGTDYVKLVLQATKQTNERFGLNHLVHVIRGVEDEYVKSYGHFDLDSYGKGSNEDADFWKSVVRQTLIFQFLEKDIDNIGVLKVTARGENFLKRPFAIELAKDHDFTTSIDEEEESEKVPVNLKAYDAKLF